MAWAIWVGGLPDAMCIARSHSCNVPVTYWPATGCPCPCLCLAAVPRGCRYDARADKVVVHYPAGYMNTSHPNTGGTFTKQLLCTPNGECGEPTASNI